MSSFAVLPILSKHLISSCKICEVANVEKKKTIGTPRPRYRRVNFQTFPPKNWDFLDNIWEKYWEKWKKKPNIRTYICMKVQTINQRLMIFISKFVSVDIQVNWCWKISFSTTYLFCAKVPRYRRTSLPSVVWPPKNRR